MYRCICGKTYANNYITPTGNHNFVLISTKEIVDEKYKIKEYICSSCRCRYEEDKTQDEITSQIPFSKQSADTYTQESSTELTTETTSFQSVINKDGTRNVSMDKENVHKKQLKLKIPVIKKIKSAKKSLKITWQKILFFMVKEKEQEDKIRKNEYVYEEIRPQILYFSLLS